MKLRCLLIDDEPPALKILASYISNINGLEIVAQCKNAIEALQKHNWSGNIRELRNVVERLIILSGKTITADDVENYVLPRK